MVKKESVKPRLRAIIEKFNGKKVYPAQLAVD